jgi:glyoxylase-like metal-dependent hydrolase (beta-lactamase superfamily II)
MKMKEQVRVLAMVATLCATALSAMAQNPAAAQPDFNKVEIKITKVTDSFYALEGTGYDLCEGWPCTPDGTVGVLTGSDGILMVDDKYAPLSGKILAAIRQVSNEPIRFLVDTHVHGDHTQGNENFGKIGATIVAREEVHERLLRGQLYSTGPVFPPAPPAALPTITFDGTLSFHMDGDDVDLIPVPRAHTDGDIIVRFRNADLIMPGDIYRSIQYPNIDRTDGGSLSGLLDGLSRIIALSGPNTKIVPGHGPIVGRSAVIAHRDMILTVRDRVSLLVQQGKTVEEVLAAHPTSEYDEHIPQSGRYLERFVRQLYAELKPAT